MTTDMYIKIFVYMSVGMTDVRLIYLKSINRLSELIDNRNELVTQTNRLIE